MQVTQLYHKNLPLNNLKNSFKKSSLKIFQIPYLKENLLQIPMKGKRRDLGAVMEINNRKQKTIL
ncbi:hypothetical protein B4U78_015320 [Microbacterium esteraromaticum]|nr:hypothetical protein B4U78_015320 [Microbacterium esteraromaticum]